MKRIAVFCGSNSGANPRYLEAARELGTLMAARDLELVYGGAHVGLMGAIADAILAAGGRARGVIPRALSDKELAHDRLTELFVVGSMHERKAKMAELADGFIALPGGMGTLDELCEMITWAQLGIHHKPIGLCNIDGYFTRLVEFFDHAIDAGFVRAEHRRIYCVENSPAALLASLANLR